MKRKIVDSMTDWFEEERDKFPWYCKLWYWYVKPPFSDFRYYLRKKYQKYTTGFPHEESWNFKHWHSTMVVPRLKYFRENLNGHPTIFNSIEEWEEILDKIIWSFEHADDFIEPIYSDDYDHRWEVEENDGLGVTFSPLNETGTIDYTPVNEHADRVEEGLVLFAKYYANLWD